LTTIKLLQFLVEWQERVKWSTVVSDPIRCFAIPNARQHRQNECFCYRATLDELLADDVMEPVLRTAGYEPDEFAR
jgi:hypothetical protein